MRAEKKNGLTLLKFKVLDRAPGLVHAVSTRSGGVSSSPYNSLNLGFGTKDRPGNPAANLRILCEAAGVPFARSVRMRQAHTANVKTIDSDFDLTGDAPAVVDNTDALITNLKSVPLVALSADCAVSVFYDPVRGVVAVCHSGWRGALLSIYGKVVGELVARFHSRPEDIVVGVSPMISAVNYPVKEDFLEKLRSVYPENISGAWVRTENGRNYFDLSGLLEHQLKEFGIKKYEFAGMCTYSEAGLFYSWRRDAENAGRFGLLACLI